MRKKEQVYQGRDSKPYYYVTTYYPELQLSSGYSQETIQSFNDLFKNRIKDNEDIKKIVAETMEMAGETRYTIEYYAVTFYSKGIISIVKGIGRDNIDEIKELKVFAGEVYNLNSKRPLKPMEISDFLKESQFIVDFKAKSSFFYLINKNPKRFAADTKRAILSNEDCIQFYLTENQLRIFNQNMLDIESHRLVAYGYGISYDHDEMFRLNPGKLG